MSLETTTLGAGCFWCVEAVYQDLRGVASGVSGYMGGAVEHPTYEAVCSGQTGHAEVVQLQFDPEVISFDDVLYIFWRTHDPTTLNRQGADRGTQYRSVIFHHSPEQQAAAVASKATADASDLWADPIVTEIAPASAFWPAEDYHQNYYRLNPNQPYCAIVIDPKMQAFRQKFADRLQPTA
ncbi:MAG: peptide-methionine (S)-S-oxide reductase MsrA [Gemmatimonadetes bacterium]|nr:peptide-methionine (S)-S-oxide reductase MsrA [Gemmatimonadota bacterium]MXY83509.1 peptide-methionine (S)-S-oxide reductase MsrA [Gemmatimonadota bacterium]MYB67343.1 peptide-methionine (S)-S-oxide reductase MsrA [Gemmatimonadota bacterium]